MGKHRNPFLGSRDIRSTPANQFVSAVGMLDKLGFAELPDDLAGLGLGEDMV